nr:hypothetical protein [Thermus scotoductus]
MAYVLLAYLLGSLVGGLLFFPEVRAKDLPGGSGVFRRKGPWAALWVVLWDLGKGALALLLVPSEWRVWACLLYTPPAAPELLGGTPRGPRRLEQKK